MGQPAAYRRYFDGQAASYDDHTEGDRWTPNVYLADALTPLLTAAASVGTVLDLGAGTGQTLIALSRLFPAAQLWGVDVSSAMLERAARRVPSAQLTVADVGRYVRDLDRAFDLVTMIGCAELVADLPAVLTALGAHVTPQGHLALTLEPLVDGLGVDLESPAESDDGYGEEPRRRHHWGPADVLGALAGAELVTTRLFRAYERGDDAVLNELLVLRLP